MDFMVQICMKTHWWHGKHSCSMVCHVVLRCVLIWPLFAIAIFKGVLISLREKDDNIIRAPFSFGGALSDLYQMSHVNFRGWFTKKDAFLLMRCQITFIGMCMASLDLSRLPRAGWVPGGSWLFLTSLAVVAGCAWCSTFLPNVKLCFPSDLWRYS